MIVNELAQWAVLLFIAVFVFGLTRQLGNFLVPKREQAALDVGPPVGRKLPPDLLTPTEQAQIRMLCEEKGIGWAMLLVVSEDCVGCKDLPERIRETGTPEGAPIVALSRKSGREYTASLREIADMVVVDGDRINAAGLTVTPFMMIVDPSLTVLHKQIGWDPREVVETWQGGDGRPNGDGLAPDGLETLSIVRADRSSP